MNEKKLKQDYFKNKKLTKKPDDISKIKRNYSFGYIIGEYN